MVVDISVLMLNHFQNKWKVQAIRKYKWYGNNSLKQGKFLSGLDAII